MTRSFWDIRMFGAVLSTKTYNAGQVRGPVQLTFGRSVDPLFPQDISITRVAITREEELEDKETEMGRKQLIPYGPYVAKGSYSAPLGQQTGVSTEDLELLWKALEGMWEIDRRSVSRGFSWQREGSTSSRTTPGWVTLLLTSSSS